MSRRQLFWGVVLGDIGLFLLLLGLFFSSANPFITTILSLLCVIFPFAWVATYQRKGILFIPDSYVHAVRSVILAFLVVSLCVVVARLPYSLTVLGAFLGIWLIGAVALRRWARSVMQPVRCVAVGVLDKALLDAPRIVWIPLDQGQAIQFGAFDVVVYQERQALDENARKFLLHAQVVGIPVLSDQTLTESIFGRVAIENLQANWLPGSFSFHPLHLWIKRVVDVGVVIVLSPLLLILSAGVAICIRWQMGSPVLFTQTRVGQEGHAFLLYKFRTMSDGAESLGETQSREDIRITPLGRILRKYRLDELPQCWNVLKGEMSLIGPRPEWAKTAAHYVTVIPLYSLRNLVKPGITGWAQVHQGYAIGVEETHIKLCYDLFYVKHFSLWLDAIIALRTLWVIATGYRAR